MPADDDIGLDEKRVYGETRDGIVAYVGSDIGLTEVTISGDQVGRFSLVRREEIADVAGQDGQLIVAAEDDVLVGTESGFEATGFSSATAVGIDEGAPIAAGVDGRIARLIDDDWDIIGEISDVRAIDAPYIAAADGLARIKEEGVVHVGLDDVRDVAAAGPWAATGAGLFAGGEEWNVSLQGPFHLVAADELRAHAAGDDYWVRRDGQWVTATVPTDEPVVAVAFGESTYAVTESGTFLIEAEPTVTADGTGGWRSRALGVGTVTGLGIP